MTQEQQRDAKFICSASQVRSTHPEIPPRLGGDAKLFHLFVYPQVVELWTCTSRPLRYLIGRKAINVRPVDLDLSDFELAVGTTDQGTRYVDTPPIRDPLEVAVLPESLPIGCQICDGLRDLDTTDDPVCPTSGLFWVRIDNWP